MHKGLRTSLKSFLVEFIVYSGLMTVYVLLVLRYLGGALANLFQSNRGLYAAAALLLIVAQGLLLDAVTQLLLALIAPRRED